MSGSLNKVIIIGNVGQAPDIKTFNDGGSIANLSIATSESWKDKNTGEKRERVEWHRVVVKSDGIVKVVQSYVNKGTKLYIEGQIQTRKWQDQSGNDRYSTEVVLSGYNSKLIMLSGNNNSGTNAPQQASANQAPASASAPATNNTLDDEIPW